MLRGLCREIEGQTATSMMHLTAAIIPYSKSMIESYREATGNLYQAEALAKQNSYKSVMQQSPDNDRQKEVLSQIAALNVLKGTNLFARFQKTLEAI